jgi:polar amino acid transport system substrate-binding protein
MIGSGMTLTQERNLRLNFSEPFIVVGQTLLIRKDLEGKIKTYKDLNDPQYRITSKIGTTGEMVAKKLIRKPSTTASTTSRKPYSMWSTARPMPLSTTPRTTWWR